MSFEWLAAWVLEQQRRSTGFVRQRERPRRPRGVEFVPQSVFMSEAIEDGRGRPLRSGQHGEHRAAAALRVSRCPR